MSGRLPEQHCTLAIIGSGMAGMAAALFAGQRGIDTVQIGMTGELSFASGLLDFMGVHPIETGRVWTDPWAAIKALIKDCPRHPYASLHPRDMRAAWAALVGFFNAADLPYHLQSGRNLPVLTPAGTVKPSYAVPVSCLNGVSAFENKARCLLIDFEGLKGFSGRQIVETLKPQWPGLTTRRIALPDANGEVYTEPLAQHLELPEIRRRLADRIRPHLDGVEYVGLPAVLGLYQPFEVYRDLEALLGRPVFEIPTMPPAVTGLRMRHVFERHLPRLDVLRTHYQQQVLRAAYSAADGFRLQIGVQEPVALIRAQNVILASGRFFGQGLHADRNRIVETIFNLPVRQPPGRTAWHQKSFLAPQGHPVNQAGLEIDAHMRPVDPKGKPVYPKLFAAGSILAHQDWMRMKCGSGLALTTAYAAVKALEQ